MTIYDISREILSAPIYDGDKAPELETVHSMADGSVYNLSNLHMCVHNGTHIDAPLHFIEDGASIEQISLDKCIGPCTVIECNRPLTGQRAEELLPHIKKRLLIKGNSEITQSAAFVFQSWGIKLIGVESLSVGDVNAPAAVHRELLGADVALLENLNLSNVPIGDYYLVATPLKLKGAEAAPCRAVLLKDTIA